MTSYPVLLRSAIDSDVADVVNAARAERVRDAMDLVALHVQKAVHNGMQSGINPHIPAVGEDAIAKTFEVTCGAALPQRHIAAMSIQKAWRTWYTQKKIRAKRAKKRLAKRRKAAQLKDMCLEFHGIHKTKQTGPCIGCETSDENESKLSNLLNLLNSSDIEERCLALQEFSHSPRLAVDYAFEISMVLKSDPIAAVRVGAIGAMLAQVVFTGADDFLGCHFVIPDLQAAQKDESKDVRCAATLGLVRLGVREALDHVLVMLDDADVAVRLASLRVLDVRGSMAVHCVPKIVEALKDEHECIRSVAGKALSFLATCGVEDQVSAVRGIVEMLSTPGHLFDQVQTCRGCRGCLCAVDSLGSFGDSAGCAAPMLATALGLLNDGSTNWEVLYSIIRALGKIGCAACIAVSELTRASECAHEAVIVAARKALKSIEKASQRA